MKESTDFLLPVVGIVRGYVCIIDELNADDFLSVPVGGGDLDDPNHIKPNLYPV